MAEAQKIVSPPRAAFQAAFDKLGYQWSESNQEKAFLGWQLAMVRYEALRETYRQEHPRITHAAIDAFVEGKVAGEGIAAGAEPASERSNTLQENVPDAGL